MMVIPSLLDWKIPFRFGKKEGNKIGKFDMPIIACGQGFYIKNKLAQKNLILDIHKACWIT